MNIVKRLLKEEKGSALVLCAIAMTVLLGASAIVVDYGLLSHKKRTLVNAADAAALAGAQELLNNPGSPTSAVFVAEDYAAANGVDSSKIHVELINNNTGITVKVTDSVDYLFAPILGFEKGNVEATATAATGVIGGMVGIAPLAIVEQELIKGQQYELKLSHHNETLGQGNFGPLALGGSGASNYKKNLRDGYQGMIKVGDILETEPGNMSNPTRRAILDRIGNCDSGCTYYSFSPDCPLLIYIPIIRTAAEAGRQDVEVVGFAAFFLNKNAPPGQGNESVIKGYFVDTIVPGQISPGANGYGVSAVNLTN